MMLDYLQFIYSRSNISYILLFIPGYLVFSNLLFRLDLFGLIPLGQRSLSPAEPWGKRKTAGDKSNTRNVLLLSETRKATALELK